MAICREPVRLAFDEAMFHEQMDRMRKTLAEVSAIGARQRLNDATWEPLDWSEFD